MIGITCAKCPYKKECDDWSDDISCADFLEMMKDEPQKEKMKVYEEENMKVYVVTSAKPMELEVYETVKSSAKEAEKYIRASFPNAKKDVPFGNVTGFLCKKNGIELLMFIHEETVV